MQFKIDFSLESLIVQLANLGRTLKHSHSKVLPSFSPGIQ